MTTWADVTKGDRIELRGREYTVAKVKTKGKRTAVTVVGSAGKFEAEVKTKDTVTMLAAHDKRRDKAGWYKPTKAERAAAEVEAAGLPAGNPTVTKPPTKAKDGDPWESRRGKVERLLEDVLGAHLVGESNDEDAGYYVPPQGIDTIAGHLVLFHGVDVSMFGIDDLLELHENQHEAAKAGHALKVNHWHTKTRPGAGS